LENGINLKVPREWDDPSVAPDAESQRDEEIRGKMSSQNPEFRRNGPILNTDEMD
jgi:hypothetical protein